MHCNNCGQDVDAELNFCKKCGKSLSVKKEEYKGLNGWLILVIIGLFISAGRLGYEFTTIFNIGVNYSGMEGWLLYDIITMGGLTALAIYLIYLFFKKDKRFPRLYIIFLVTLMVVNIITSVSLSFYNLNSEVINKYYENALKSIVGVIIWGLYMVKSKRVKATFIE